MMSRGAASLQRAAAVVSSARAHGVGTVGSACARAAQSCARRHLSTLRPAATAVASGCRGGAAAHHAGCGCDACGCGSSAAVGVQARRFSTPAGPFDGIESDDDRFGMESDLFGADLSEGALGAPDSDEEHEALEAGEEGAKQAILEEAGVSFSSEEMSRIRNKAREYAGVMKRIDSDAVSPMMASPMANLDPYTEFEMQQKSLGTRPEADYKWESNVIPITSDDMLIRRRGGLRQHYCVFCYHGADMLRPENTTLLSKFISDRGKIVPRRTSYCCAKHQRKLKRVVKRARQQQLLPFNQRLHPKLRTTQSMPDPDTHKPVTFTTPRDAYRAAQKYDRWSRAHAHEWGGELPQVDWFPDEE